MESADKDSPKNEIRVKGNRGIAGSLKYAYKLFEGSEEENFDTIVLRGAGSAIQNVVALSELIRRRVKGLYANTEITTLSVEETKPAKEEGEEDRTFVRHIIMLKVTLSKNPDDKMK